MIHLPRLDIPDSSYKWWALGATMIGSFMSILDTSIVNIAVPKMMAAFSVDSTKAQWILTAYMLTMGVLQPATGYLCDNYGTRRMYLLSLFVFVLGSALCGMAWSNDSMIAFRVIQAIGGGLIIPITMTIVFRNFPPEQQNMAMGIWGFSAAVAPAIGPTLSGYLVEYWDWRFIFTINIPIGIFGYVIAALLLRETKLTHKVSFDVWGFLTCSIGLFCLLLALSKGVDEGWTSFYIISLFYTAWAMLTLFVVIELQTQNPLLDLTLFKDWNFTFSMIITFILTIVLFGGLFLIPLFLENLQGYTAMQAGMLMLPAALCGGFMMPLAARLADQYGAKPFVIAGTVFLFLSAFPIIDLDLDTDYHKIMLTQIWRGIGLGLAMMTVTVMGMASVPLNKVSQASALNNTLRQISSSFGIAILSTVVQNRQIFHLAQSAESITQSAQAVQLQLQQMMNLFSHQGNAYWTAHEQALYLMYQTVYRQSQVFAFDDAFVTLSVIASLGILAAFLLKPKRK